MSRYPHNRDQSAELFRLAMQRISKCDAGFTPFCYAVWYEYLSGLNPDLSSAVDDLLEQGKPLDEVAVEQLFNKYVSELDVEATRELQSGAYRILEEISRHTAEADNSAHEFENSLEKTASRLGDKPGADMLVEVVGALKADTGKMQAAVQALTVNLEASRKEVSELERALDKVQKEVISDPMTGVFNRRGFEVRLSEMIANAQNGAPLCLMMADIDYFKKVNDTYGHLFGDKVIGALASTLTANVKGQDAVARLGGEEFAVLLPETKPEGGMMLAEKVRSAVERGKIRQSGKPDPIGGITVSLGVTAYIPGEPVDVFIERADKALYASKGGGRNRVTLG
jgi:diguanylate cyclase